MDTPLPNNPDLWHAAFPWPAPNGNKYDRGHAIVMGGELHSTGASKLAAAAALRIGAGLVSIACNARTLAVYASSLHAVMTKPVETAPDFAKLLEDKRITSVLLGPGAGITRHTRAFVLTTLAARKATVLDADALGVFADKPTALFSAIHAPCILTPHEGEFTRLFGKMSEDALTRAHHATQASGAVIILKGFHTHIVAPDGRAAINTNATPFLATAGTGDVLAGICTGLLAQSMPAFEAACAAVWLHAEAGRQFGPGLTAEDITPALPALLKRLYTA